MKKIVLAALLAATAITPVHADEADDFCAGAFLYASVLIDENPAAANRYRSTAQEMVSQGIANQRGAAKAAANFSDQLVAGDKTVGDFLEVIQACSRNY